MSVADLWGLLFVVVATLVLGWHWLRALYSDRAVGKNEEE